MSEWRTLIVDDEETYARGLQRLLSRRGIEADVAMTAAEGLLKARRHPYILVLLDHMLPDGSGLDLDCAAAPEPPRPAVLMMTAYGTIENAVEAMRRGASDYVPKSTALPDVVERVVEAERVARASRQLPAASQGQPGPASRKGVPGRIAGHARGPFAHRGSRGFARYHGAAVGRERHRQRHRRPRHSQPVEPNQRALRRHRLRRAADAAGRESELFGHEKARSPVPSGRSLAG